MGMSKNFSYENLSTRTGPVNRSIEPKPKIKKKEKDEESSHLSLF